jgi:hypothetical protein
MPAARKTRTTKPAATDTKTAETKAVETEQTATKPAAVKKPVKAKKYDDKTVAATRAAQVYRGRKNAVASVTVLRVMETLAKRETTAEQVVKAFKNLTEAKAYASGDKAIAAPDLVKEISATHEDAFGRGRGLVSICLALRDVK